MEGPQGHLAHLALGPREKHALECVPQASSGPQHVQPPDSSEKAFQVSV